MSDTNEDSGTEWYEEPITIVGFVAGFLLLILVVASILILCHSKDEDEDEDDEIQEDRPPGLYMNGRGVRTPRGPQNYDEPLPNVNDRTNPLYLNANEFSLQPFSQALRAKFVHIHVDDKQPKESNFMAYYNT